MKATIYDIAIRAGVSRTTVSNVMNGNDKCSEKTKNNIIKIANELGYQPNLAARALVNKKTKLLGLVLPDYASDLSNASTPFYNLILNGVSKELTLNKEYDLIINSSRDKKDIKRWVLMRNLDGIILIGEYETDFLASLNYVNVPTVLIDNYNGRIKNGIFINSDDRYGGYLAVNHLVQRGYQKIAIALSGQDLSPLLKKRLIGYQEAIAENGLPAKVIDTDHQTFQHGQAIGKLVLEMDIDSLFTMSDMAALGVMNTLLRHNVKIPGEFGIVGFDNISSAAQFIPGLTTIDQNIVSKGSRAVKMLLEIIDDKREGGERIILPVDLIQRETT